MFSLLKTLGIIPDPTRFMKTIDPVTAAALIGGGAGLLGKVGDLFGGKSAQKSHDRQVQQARQDIAAYQSRLGQYQGQLRSAFEGEGGLLGQMLAPQVSSTEYGSTTNTNQLTAPEVSAQFKPTLDMLQQAYTNRVAEADFLPEGLLEGEYQNIATEQEAGNRELENIARARGVDPSVLRIGSPVMRQAAAARSAARRGAEDLKYARKGQSLGELANLAQIWGRGERTRGRSSTTGSSTTSGPANFSGALSYYGLLRPEKPDVVV